MGRLNIQNPKTGKWRCWSTIVDDYVSGDWKDAKEYKDWLIAEAANKVREELNIMGIRRAEYQTYAECEYILALNHYCESCDHTNCDDCKYNLSFNAYKEQGNNYFNIDLGEEK